jgi:pyrroline-5-carboxylate reductase
MYMDKPVIGFIGYGNMAQAIAQGLVNAGVVPGERIVACAGHFDKLERNAVAIGAQAKHDAAEVVEAADIVVVAVKPYQIEGVLGPVSEQLKSGKPVIVSIAGGWGLEQYRELLGDGAHVQCAIPNTPIAVGKGILVTEESNTLSDEEAKIFEEIFSPIAQIERVDSEHLGIATDIAGCAPAFTAMYIEALGDAGVQHGLQRATAYRLAAAMAEGVGALYLATGTHPGAMKDAVCSPGGSTIRGVVQLEKDGFRGSVIDAINAIAG